MAFQVDEKLLSKLAQQHLNNAKSKAQFVRDAIEYYVVREQDFKELLELKEDISQIKISINNISSGSVAIKETNQNTDTTIEEIKKEDTASFDEDIPDCYE